MANPTENFMSRITQALSKPIQARCAELTVLFDKASIKDAQNVFPMIIDTVFGPQSSQFWELRSITQSKNFQDFQALLHFFSPHGPIFRLIYTLLRDPQIKYDFSLIYLPAKIRHSLDTASCHPFYTENLNINSQTKQVMSLVLNPFDYYLFHFAYHLINPLHQRVTSNSRVSFGSGTVYYNLCCDYLLYFLPTDPNCTILPLTNYYIGKNPVQALPTFTRPPKVSKLLRPNIFADTTNEFNAVHQAYEQHPRNHTWRSETVLILFVDMWLCNDQIVENEQSFSPTKFQQNFQFNDLPTAEYIRTVRVLVKHLHSFSASAKFDDTYMTELKKQAVPYMQGKMYIFLRNLVHLWPLDGSFRLVLELWLSFIQPWRYHEKLQLKLKLQSENNLEIDDNGIAPMKSVDREYLPFIVENFLAYIVIFQQLLPRFAKVDLSSPKNALMLYRMLKVIAQPNLVNLLKEVESTLENINTSPSQGRWSSGNSHMPPSSNWGSSNTSLSSSYSKDSSYQFLHASVSVSSALLDSSTGQRIVSARWPNIIKQKIYELENLNFCYKALFASEPPQEVYDLIWHIKKGECTANAIIKLRKDEEIKNSRGFFGFLKSVLLQIDYDNDEFTLEERMKVPIYLQLSLQFLIEIFQVKNPNLKTTCREDVPAEERTVLSPKQLAKNDFPFLLTPEKVRERIKRIKYEGDPDLYPIRSDENKFLVRTLYQLSQKLNEQFGAYILRLYYESSFLGKICREVMCPPITIYKYDKNQPGRSPRIPERLPPRISLRQLANHKFLIYMTVGAMVFNMLGIGPLAFLLILFVCWSIRIVWRALFCRKWVTEVEEDSCRRQLNLSLNDSFN